MPGGVRRFDLVVAGPQEQVQGLAETLQATELLDPLGMDVDVIDSEGLVAGVEGDSLPQQVDCLVVAALAA